MSLIQVSQSIVSASTLKVVIENCSNVSTSGPTNGHSDEDEPCSVIFSIRCSHPHIFYCLSGSSIEQVSATRESGSLDDSIPDMQAVSDRTWVHYGVPISSTSSPLPNSSRKQSSHVFRRPLLIAEDVADGLLRPGEKCVFYFSVDNCSIIQATEDSRSSEGDSLGQSDGVLRRRSALSQRSQVFSAIQRASPGSSAEDYSEYPSKKISAISTYSYHPDRPTFYVYYERLGNESGCVNHAREWMLHEKEKYVSWRDKYLDAVAKLEMGRRGPPMLRHRADSLLAESKLERSGSSSSSSFLTADAAPPPRRVCPPILGEGVRWRQQSASEVKAQRDPSSLNSHAIASLCYYYSGWRDCAESKPIVPYTSTRVHGSSKKASAMFSPKRTGGGTALCPLRGSIFRRTSCPNSPISHGLQGGQDDSRHSSAAGQSPRSSNNLRQVEEPRRAMVLSPVVHLSPREFPSNGKQDTPRLEPRLSISLTSPRSHNAVDKLAPGRGLALLLEQSEEKLAPLVGTTSRSFSGLPPSPSPAARSPRAAGESPTASTPSASRSSPPQAQTRVRSSEEQSPASKRVQGHARTATLDPTSAAALMDTGDHVDNFSLSNGSLRLSSTMGSTHDVTPEQSSQLSGMNPEVYNAEKRPSYIQHSVDNVLQLFSIVSENLPSVMDVARCDTAATASPPHSLIPSSSAASITARRPVSLTNGCRTQLKLRSPSGNEALRQVDGIDKVKDRLVSVASSLQVEVWPYIEQASRLVLEHSPNAFTAVQSAVTDVLGSSRSATILRWIAMPLAAALVLQIMWVMFFESVDDTATMCVSSLREGLW